MDCNDFRKTYRECVEESGYRQCRIELDNLFTCLHRKEKHIYYNVSSPPFPPATGEEIRRNDTTQQKGKL